MRIKLTTNDLQTLEFFTRITHTTPKDVIIETNEVVFVVAEEDMARAVGTNGTNAKRLEQELKKNITIMPYNREAKAMLSAIIAPTPINNIEEKEGILIITPADQYSRGALIGRSGEHLRMMEKVLKRFFPNIKRIAVK